MSEKKENTEPIAIVWTTVATVADARTLAALMLESRLAACVQIDSPIESHYHWQGQTRADSEYRLIIKTRAAVTGKLIHWLKENHPYEEPQILVTPVTEAAQGYAQWVIEQTT